MTLSPPAHTRLFELLLPFAALALLGTMSCCRGRAPVGAHEAVGSAYPAPSHARPDRHGEAGGDELLVARPVVASAATVRHAGEIAFRGIIPIWHSDTGIDVTEATAFTKVGSPGICIDCYSQLPPLPGSVRRFRFVVVYSDTVQECSSHSLMRLASYDDADDAHFEWPIARTWSGTSLYHSRTSDWFDGFALSTCGSTWRSTCAVYAKLDTSCAGAKLRIRSIALEYADVR